MPGTSLGRSGVAADARLVVCGVLCLASSACGAWWCAPALLAFWTAVGALGYVTPTVNCLVFAAFERVRLGYGKIRRDERGHFYVDLGPVGRVEWAPSRTRLGWERRATLGRDWSRS